MKLIDKDALVAEIERRVEAIRKAFNEPGILSGVDRTYANAQYDAFKSLFPFLDTLEVKEEILDKEGKTELMKKCVHKAYQRGYDMGVLQTTNKIKHNTKKVDLEKEFDNYAKDILACDVQFQPFTHLYNCAKYFYELGIMASNKSQKRE